MLRASLPVRSVQVRPNFGEAASPEVDLSGMASDSSLNSRQRRCIVINDEGRHAQYVRLDLDAPDLTPGNRVELIPSRQRDLRAVGVPPVLGEAEEDGFGSLDGEGAAYLAPWYYVTGSHGCRRKRDRYQLSSFLVTRFRPGDATAESSFRLCEVLSSLQPIARSFGLPLSDNGVSIEGMAAAGDRLYFGFRTPVGNGIAYLVAVDAAALFLPDTDLKPSLTSIEVGIGRGIRDLAALPDGRLLVLDGPAHKESQLFRILLVDLAKPGLRQIVSFDADTGDKPEGVLLAALSAGPDGTAAATLLILRDGVVDGGPVLLDVVIPPP